MGLPRYHEQPVLLLMYRTIQNLEFVDQHKQHVGPFEVTQLVNSFLAVAAHPWDRLLDQEQLKKIRLGSPQYRKLGFPEFVSLPVAGQPADMDSLYDLLRVLRNGMAHGNMDLLSRKEIRLLRPLGPLPRIKEDEIAGIRLWNQKDPNNLTWCTALSVFEMRQTLDGMMRLCQKRSLWKAEILAAQEERDNARRRA